MTRNVAFVAITSDLTLDEIADIIEKLLRKEDKFVDVNVEGFFEFGDA